MNQPFTGRHMAMAMVGGFGIVIAVNLFMATLAVGGFSGVVVPNSYVASQKFNGWLGRAEAQDALGWDISASQADDGTMRVAMRNVPQNAVLTAIVRRPLGEPDEREIALAGDPGEGFRSTEPLPEGRWLVRLSVVSGSSEWRGQSELP